MEIKQNIQRKGIIFALDAALAVTVVIIILINSSYYFSTASKESLSQLQPVRIGGDVIALLDFGGSFDYAYSQDLEAHRGTIPQTSLNVSAYLPKNYAMRYAVSDMKETPTTNLHCPGSYCQTEASVTCDGSGCTLPQNAWISVKPITIQADGSWKANILNPGGHFIAFDTTRTSATLNALIEVDGNVTSSFANFDADTGIYLLGNATLPYFEAGDSEKNWIKITNKESVSLTINWIRVIGDESYMRGAYSEETITALPADRFIGTGERFISIIEPDGDFEGYHLVRYWIWLKTVAPS